MSELDRILNGGPGGNGAKREAALPPKNTDAEDAIELPEPGSPYQAHARASNKPVYTLHCLLGKEGCFSFQYVNLDSHSTFRAEKEGQIIVLRFSGTKIWEVTINGLNLWQLYDYIHQHRMPWIMKSDRGFAANADKEPLIRGIDIKDVTPKEPA